MKKKITRILKNTFEFRTQVLKSLLYFVFQNMGAMGISLFLIGCSNLNYTTGPYHPGPALGRAVGTGVGVVGGNAVGVPVGLGEGMVKGAAAPFNNTTRVVRRWHTETTSDGRTIQVPEDILVDANGRPVYTQAR